MAQASLQGNAILVTGGGTGIGSACARLLVGEGAAVTISGRTESSLLAACESITAELGSSAQIDYVVGDVTDERSVQAMLEKASTADGQLHGCVANAGGGGMPMSYAAVDTAEFKRVLDLNVMGTLLCIKHSIPCMLKAGGGSFVGMSSLAGHVTHPFFHAYCAGKAGVEAMIRNAADEYGAKKLRFNAIRPGFIATEIMEGIPRDSEVFQSYIDNTPMNEVGEPDDVAHLARFLLGQESRWITGQVINVDGGHCLRRGPDFSSFAVQ